MRRYALLLALAVVSTAAFAQNNRHITFHYLFTVNNVPLGERLRVWIPLAHSDAFQTVKVVTKTRDLPLKQVQQPQDGNEVLYAETPKAAKSEYQFSVDYDVVRREHIVLVDGKPMSSVRAHDPATEIQLARFLAPDRLVPISGKPAQIAAEETKTSPLFLLQSAGRAEMPAPHKTSRSIPIPGA